MPKQITFKKQGDGKDSWIIKETDSEGKLTKLPEIVYFDPTDTSEKTIKLTDYELFKLKELLK